MTDKNFDQTKKTFDQEEIDQTIPFMMGKFKRRGQPTQYNTAEDLENAVCNYFIYCKKNKLPANISSLCLYLGFSSRQALSNIINNRENKSIVAVAERAKLAIECAYEQRDGAMAIFCLKNMGWVDKQEVKQEMKLINPIRLCVDTEDLNI